MKLKSLLSLACLAATLQASAVYPIYFRDSGNIVDNKIVPENGGHMEYPIDENGQPIFDEDGAITVTTNAYADGGVWLRTKKLTSPCPMEYTILAFEYKTNRQINNLVVFQHSTITSISIRLTGRYFSFLTSIRQSICLSPAMRSGVAKVTMPRTTSGFLPTMPTSRKVGHLQ